MNPIEIKKKEFRDELDEVIEDCSGWDSESAAIEEAFKRGIGFQKKQCR